MNHLRKVTGFRLWVGVLLAPVAAGCVANPLDEGSADDSTTQTTTSGTTGTPATTTPTGVDCGQDPTSGVTLCVGSSVCPSDEINPDDYPGCGFRTISPSFDLECLCDGNELCPIGIAATCGDIATLLNGRTVADICNQIGSGTCLEVGSPTTATTGTGGQPGASSTCDTDCASDCANAPTCLTACGC